MPERKTLVAGREELGAPPVIDSGGLVDVGEQSDYQEAEDPGLGPAAFGRLLRAIRTERGATLAQFGSRIGLDQSALSKLERGMYDVPSRERLLHWAKVLELEQFEIDELLISLMYMPNVPYAASFTRGDRRVLAAALREVLPASGSPTGNVSGIKDLWKRVTTWTRERTHDTQVVKVAASARMHEEYMKFQSARDRQQSDQPMKT